MELEYKEQDKKRTAFHCSDYDKLDIDIYYSFVGETKTNPVKWNETLKWGAGKGTEMQMLEILKMNDKINQDYVQEVDGRVDMIREGVEIHGYIDAMTKEGLPIEIKSINNKNSVDVKKFGEGYPRESYVGQLAMYMDFLGKDIGYLFVSTIDGLDYFWFTCRKTGEGIYQCGHIEVDLNKTYREWSVLYTEHILKSKTPECLIRYKIPVEEVDWKSVSKTDISKARNGHKVIGDPDSWKITYSSWKDKIIQGQGVELGYDHKEIEYILEATKGYTNWK